MTNETRIQLKNILYNQIANTLQLFAYEPWNEKTRDAIKRSINAIVQPVHEYNVMFDTSLELAFDDETNGVTLLLKYKENPDDEKYKVVEFTLGFMGSDFKEVN